MATSGTFNIAWNSGWFDIQTNYKQYHWSGTWTKNGNIITLSNQKIYLTFRYVCSAYGYYDTISTSGGSAVRYNFPTWSNTTTSSEVSLNNSSFGVDSSATSATITCAITDEVTGSTTISFDPTYQAPATPTVTASNITYNSLKVTYGTTSFGYPTTGAIYLYGSTNSEPSTVIAFSNSTGDHEVNISGLVGNTAYHYRSNANNGQRTSAYSTEITSVTLCAAPTVSLSSVTETSATIAYTLPADGGYYDKTLKYSFDGTVWITVGTPQSIGTFVIENLTEETSYTVYVALVTTAGTGNAAMLEFSTGVPSNLYGSVNSLTKKVKKLYGSVNGSTKRIVKLYGSVDGNTKRVL